MIVNYPELGGVDGKPIAYGEGALYQHPSGAVYQHTGGRWVLVQPPPGSEASV